MQMHIQQIIRRTTSPPGNHAGVSVFALAFMSMCTYFSPLHSKKDETNKRCLLSRLFAHLKTVMGRPRPPRFNNNSLDPLMRGGGPDMRRCDSSGAADTIAGFSFDCLAELEYLLLLKTAKQMVVVA